MCSAEAVAAESQPDFETVVPFEVRYLPLQSVLAIGIGNLEARHRQEGNMKKHHYPSL